MPPRASATAAAMPAYPPPTMPTGVGRAASFTRLRRKPGFPREPQLGDRCERDFRVQHLARVGFDLVQQALVDRRHDEPRALRAPINGRALPECLPVEAA